MKIKFAALGLLVVVFILLLFPLIKMINAFPGLNTAEPPSETLPPEETDTPEPISFLPLKTTPDWTAVPGMASALDMKDVQYTVLLLGMDTRPAGGKYYTDVLMLVILKTDGTISLVSIPRNTLVYVPGWEMAWINEVLYESGDFNVVGDTFQYNFGIRPDAYVAIDFSGFKNLIDDLGGIDVIVQSEYQGKCDVAGQKWCAVLQGEKHMTGEYALWYVRSRTTAFSDIDRNRRQQEVFMAIVNKIAPWSWTDIPDQISAFYEFSHCCMFSNLGLGDILQLVATKHVNLSPMKYSRYPLYMYVDEYISPEGKYFLIPDLEGFKRTLISAISVGE